MVDSRAFLCLQVDKNVGGGPVPAYIQAVNSQITNNVATTQGGGINAATSDGVVLVSTELSENFGESLAHPPCLACARHHDIATHAPKAFTTLLSELLFTGRGTSVADPHVIGVLDCKLHRSRIFFC